MKIVTIPKCLIGYSLGIITLGLYLYSYFQQPSLWQYIYSRDVVAFAAAQIPFFTVIIFMIKDLNDRFGFIRWYGIKFEVKSCDDLPDKLVRDEL